MISGREGVGRCPRFASWLTFFQSDILPLFLSEKPVHNAIRHFSCQSRLLIFFSFLPKSLCCKYSLEAPWYNVYSQHTFSWKNKKTSSIFQLKKVPFLELEVCSFQHKIILLQIPTVIVCFHGYIQTRVV